MHQLNKLTVKSHLMTHY